MKKSYSEQMEEQLEPRPERKAGRKTAAVLLVGAGFGLARLVADMMAQSEFFPEPTAHEIWVRNRIPRGTHYDPADDGPETDIGFRAWVRRVVERVALTQVVEDVLASDGWLNAHSHSFVQVHDEITFWEHPRE